MRADSERRKSGEVSAPSRVAVAKIASSKPDLAGREAVTLGDDDQDEDHPRDREVPEPVEERARTQERLPPEEPEALARPARASTQGRAPAAPERASASARATGTRTRRERVDDERERTRDPEERAAERRPEQLHGRAASLDRADRGRKLRARHDRLQRARLGGAEDDRPHALDERCEQDQPERGRVGERGRRRASRAPARGRRRAPSISFFRS